MRSSRGVHRTRGERGAAAVETALCICFIVLPLTFAAISYAYMFSFRQALSQAASEGARAAVGTSVAVDAQGAARSAVTSALRSYGVACTTGGNLTRGAEGVVGTCEVSAPNTSCTGSSGAGACITVTLNYRYREHSMLPTIPGLGFTQPPDLSFTSVVETS